MTTAISPTVGEHGDELVNNHQYVTFFSGGEVFATDMAPVQEIIRLPEIVRVPLAPSALDGLANLRGRVLPIISLRRLFGFEELQKDDATRAIVIDLGQPVGFVVDKVASVVSVEAEQMEPVANVNASIDTEMLTGILKAVGGHQMVMVLDFAKLVAQEFAGIRRSLGGMQAVDAGNSLSEQEEIESDELQLVSFAVAGEEYAIDIANVQEIVQVPEKVVQVPKAAPHVLGLMTLRERLLPLVSLRALFSLPKKTLDERCRVVVVAAGNATVGLVTDSVSEVLRVSQELAEPLPALLNREQEMAEITAICRLNNGGRLVSVLSAEKMFNQSAIKAAIAEVNSMATESNVVDDVHEDGDDEEQVVVFQLDQGEFGVAIHAVQEIVRIPEQLTRVPQTPPFVEGVINLRGSVLPVIDQRVRLSLPQLERNDRQRIMVFVVNNVRTGFIVDAVTEVLKISKRDISVAPALSSAQTQLLGRVANLPQYKRMIQLLEPTHLIEENASQQLSDWISK